MDKARKAILEVYVVLVITHQPRRKDQDLLSCYAKLRK